MRSLILVSCAALALCGCTTEQKDRVSNTTAAICTSLPLAQAAYNAAVQSQNQNTVNFVLTTLTTFCPTVLAGIQLVPVREPVVPPPPPPPLPTPERG